MTGPNIILESYDLAATECRLCAMQPETLWTLPVVFAQLSQGRGTKPRFPAIDEGRTVGAERLMDCSNAPDFLKDSLADDRAGDAVSKATLTEEDAFENAKVYSLSASLRT